MNLHIIDDEKEVYKEYKNILREQSKIAISIYEIPDEDKNQIENALQELLVAQVIRQTYDELRARGVSDEFLDDSDLRSSLTELPLPERDRKILEAKVRQLARRLR